MEYFNAFLQDYQNNYKSIISELFYGVLETNANVQDAKLLNLISKYIIL